ncbi:putative manganese-dependent inorganic diphosphatase [Thermodesulfovibrionales bacterium]|nr:putative manganese-dependent inorganic diphosphatase [Thermodesulfovibrionales bacterium]
MVFFDRKGYNKDFWRRFNIKSKMATEYSKRVYVIGHKNPDVDSVCSAIGYAYFKNLTDRRFLFVPARAGKLNKETTFVLSRFNVPAPDEIESLTPTVSDLEFKKPISVHMHDSVHVLALLFREKGVRTVPVIDNSGRLTGIVGLRDIARHYMDSVGFADMAKVNIGVDMLIKTVDCLVISNTKGIDYLRGKIFISAMQKGTILHKVYPGDIVVIGDQHDIQIDLIYAGCSVLIVVDGIPVSSEVIAAAGQQGTLLLSSPHNAFTTFQLMTMSVSVESIMAAENPSVGLFTPIADLRKKVLESDYRSVAIIDSDNHLIGFITRTDLLHPVRKRAILVDHNEISQAVDGVEDVEILEIIDHHRVGDISTAAPIFVYNDPVGSTCTVVACTMFLHQVRIPVEIAGLLLSGILSDTLMLTLSTTTERDHQTAKRLAEMAGISIKEYEKELLSNSINIEGRTATDLIEEDFKEFLIGGKRLGVSQMMVLDYEQIGPREKEFLLELERIRTANNYDLSALLITNPLGLKQERILLKGEAWIVEKAFNVKVRNDTCILPRVLSRKKDFIPAIGQVLGMTKEGDF